MVSFPRVETSRRIRRGQPGRPARDPGSVLARPARCAGSRGAGVPQARSL